MGESESMDSIDRYSRLFESINDPALKSSVRLTILISLGMNRRLNFSDLLKLTGSGKGSLHNHISRLESAGYVVTTRYSFFSSPKVRVEITQKGREVVKRYLEIVSHI
ncbi:MAG: transcriptional regulator [Candidatus Thermoplasmatota archaeon]|jgi:DNA-binding MarR family transcriptional regulator|nr:transcriptional regulator [Candidatus Thermoplasmatota archaeon]